MSNEKLLKAELDIYKSRVKLWDEIVNVQRERYKKLETAAREVIERIHDEDSWVYIDALRAEIEPTTEGEGKEVRKT